MDVNPSNLYFYGRYTLRRGIHAFSRNPHSRSQDKTQKPPPVVSFGSQPNVSAGSFASQGSEPQAAGRV